MVGRGLREVGAAAVVVALLVLTGCGLGQVGRATPGDDATPASPTAPGDAPATRPGKPKGPASPKTPEVPAVPEAQIAISPADGATGVLLDEPVTVTATDGTLRDVSVVPFGDQEPVEGVLDEAGRSWASDGGLAAGSTYRVAAVAVNKDGVETSVTQTFQTLAIDTVLGTEIYPDGETVGVGHPIIVNFTTPVADEAKADVERALTVEAKGAAEGAWHWFGDDTVHYRPKEYWPAYTEVTIRLDLKGVSGGEGVWGIKNKVKRFTVGRSVVSKVDLDEHTQKVYVDGELARTIQITGGKPGWETRSGVKVVLEKRRDITFRSETIGITDKNSPDYYNLSAPYALRVTWSGEFHHSADWSRGSHGQQNVSHGCVGMSIPDSRWLWELSQVGDVVEVTGSDKPMDVFGNGYGDWNLSWDEWLAGSALAS